MDAQLLILLILGLCAVSTLAHDPIVEGVSTGAQFSTWQRALAIPTNKKSLSAKRVATCAYPYFWLKFTGKKGDKLDVSATTTAADGLKNVRLSVAVFGPGLPKASKKFAFPTPRTAGAKVYAGPSSVSSCSWIKSKEKRAGYSIIKKRCGTYSATTGVGFFPILDNVFTLPATGTYYFNFFTQGQYSAWFSVATGSVSHSHATVALPKPPKGNGPKNFFDKTAAAKCCKAGCPARKIYA